ncbi:MAG: pentapeptide repeat-containing protein [Anaerolineae bacterium]|nr:pentapeptide repeat-containing protein [Anaerolineae bacterium]
MILLIEMPDWQLYNDNTQKLRKPIFWDFFELLIVPAALLLAGLFLEFVTQRRQKHEEQLERQRQKHEEQLERQRQKHEEHLEYQRLQQEKESERAIVERHRKAREALEQEQSQRVSLRDFMDRIEFLYMSSGEHLFEVDEPARATARARIKHMLYQVDSLRKQRVVDFLLDSKLALVSNDEERASVLKGLSLKQIDLCGLSMRGIDLAEVDLESAKFEGEEDSQNPDVVKHCNLQGANLSNANLSGVRFSRALLESCDFSQVQANVESIERENSLTWFVHSRMHECDFSFSNLWHVQFKNTILIGAKFYGTTFQECSIQDSDLTDAVFDSSDKVKPRIARTEFSNSVLAKLRFEACEVSDVIFQSCELSQAKFTSSELSDVDFSTSTIDGSSDFGLTSLQRIKFPTGKPLRGITFEKAELTDIVFEDVDLTGANFRQSSLKHVSFKHCELSAVDFSQAEIFEGVTFENTELLDANFAEIVFHTCICSDRDLVQVKWDDEKIIGFEDLHNRMMSWREEQKQREQENLEEVEKALGLGQDAAILQNSLDY